MKADYHSINIEIDAVIGQVVKTLDPAILAYFKDYFEKNLFYLYGNKLEMALIVDAQAVISDAIAYSKKGKSFLMELFRSPFIKAYSPTWLREEVNKKIPEIAEKEGINESILTKSVRMLLEKVKVVDPSDEIAYIRAWACVGYGDPRDVPYVALYFSIRSHGILTRDKDITGAPEIKTWERPGIVGRVVSTFERGAFSFLIVGEILPAVFKFLYVICVSLLNIVWRIVQTVGDAVYNLLRGGITAISKLPEWVKALVGIGSLVLLLWEKSRKAIVDALRYFISGIIQILNWFYQAIKNVTSTIAPLVEISIEVFGILFLKIEETIATYAQLSQGSGGVGLDIK